MSNLYLKIVVVTFISILALAMPLSMTRARAKENELSVTGTVLTTKCQTSEHNLAELRLRFEFTNSSLQPMILNKSDIEIENFKYFALIDEQTDKVHFGLINVDRLRGYLPEYDREIIGPRPNSHFIVLRPRQAYMFETTQWVPLIPESAANPATKQSDEYELEFELATWVNHASPLADSLGRRWTQFGRLWTQNVWSEPVKFAFPRMRTCEP